jgi:hypothetical protein
MRIPLDLKYIETLVTQQRLHLWDEETRIK